MSAQPVEHMPIARAVEVSGRLTETYLIRAGIRSGPTPSFRGIRLDDAIRAAAALRGWSPAAGDNGLKALTATVAEAAIARLYAWAIVQGQMT